MEIVEHWWNGSWGRLMRRDIWLATDGARWQMTVKVGPNEAEAMFPDETSARTQLEVLLADPERGPWRRLV